jgi:hypothetical protein
MNKVLPLLLLILTLVVPVHNADAALMRNVIQSCAFGAGVMAATTYIGLVPRLNAPILALPAAEVIATNAMIGCGIGAAGATAATLAGWVYDILF